MKRGLSDLGFHLGFDLGLVWSFTKRGLFHLSGVFGHSAAFGDLLTLPFHLLDD